MAQAGTVGGVVGGAAGVPVLNPEIQPGGQPPVNLKKGSTDGGPKKNHDYQSAPKVGGQNPSDPNPRVPPTNLINGIANGQAGQVEHSRKGDRTVRHRQGGGSSSDPIVRQGSGSHGPGGTATQQGGAPGSAAGGVTQQTTPNQNEHLPENK